MKTESKTKIAFLGGDMRSTVAAMKLAERAWDVFAWSLPERKDAYGVCFCDDMLKAVSKASALVFPVPSSLDGVSLNCKEKDDSKKTELKEIANMINKDTLIIGGRLPSDFIKYCADRQISVYDYFEAESFQIKNAYTTAEAALSIAMNSMRKNVKGARFAITGYGRIARQLSRLLLAFGAHVIVAARKDSDLTLAELEGCDTLNITREPLGKLCAGYDIIFNTVPHCIFDESFLRKLSPETLFIELASSPGGVDVSLAKRLKSNVLWAASLPGKYAPESAGELIAECVMDILEGEVSK